MTQHKVFVQKIVYLVLIGLLLLPLYLLGRPTKTTFQGGAMQLDAGGVLAKIRTENHLADVQIGEVDPSSAALQLATFGLRGVAIAYLWYHANQFEKRHDWNNVVATGNQIVFLEPHFRSIWEFLGWKLSYNASADFDDYRERYRWVIRGFDFVARGLNYNQQEPKLEKWAGWTISQKIGIADENEQYRRLLRDDEPFGLRYGFTLPSERDNWLLGRHWYSRGEKLVLQGILPGQETLFLYFSRGRLNLVNYAAWIRKDGARQSGEPIFGVVAIEAWKNAQREWIEFGKKEMPTAVMNPEKDTPVYTTLIRVDEIEKLEAQLRDELYAILPGFTERLVLQRWNELAEVPGQQAVLLPQLTANEITDELRIVRDYLDAQQSASENAAENDAQNNWRERFQKELDALYTQQQRELKKTPQLFLDEAENAIVNDGNNEVYQITSRSLSQITLTPKVVAELLQDEMSLSAEERGRARAIEQEIGSYAIEKQKSTIYSDIINYKPRAREIEVEQTEQVDNAREFRYLGRKAYYSSDPLGANRNWIAAMQKWEDLISQAAFADLRSGNKTAMIRREIMDLVERYVFILDANRTIFPLDYPLQSLVRSELDQRTQINSTIKAQEFAKQVFARGDYAKSLGYAMKLLAAWDGVIRGGEDYVRLAPLPEMRLGIPEAFAIWVTSNHRLRHPFSTDVPCKSFVDEMMRHDPDLEQLTEPTDKVLELVREKKYAEAQPLFLNEILPRWKEMVQKYPAIPLDPAQNYRLVVNELMAAWKTTCDATGADFSSFRLLE